VRQIQAFAALNASCYAQMLPAPVKAPGGEALNHAEPAIQAIHHPFYDNICMALGHIPESKFVANAYPSAGEGEQVFLAYQVSIPNGIAQRTTW
jgi:hypothetical protein